MRRRRLSTQQIEAFRAVMLAGSVNAAARQLALSQPSLTRLIKRTEDLVGFRLFDLIKNRLIPTAEARVLMRHVEYIGEQLDDLEGAILRVRENGRGLFRFGCSPSLGRTLVPEGLTRFRLRYPATPIHFDTIQLQTVIDYLVLGRGELFLSIVPVFHSSLETRALWPARLVCLLPANHALATRSKLRATELEHEPLILSDPARWYGQQVHQTLANCGLDAKPDIIVQVADNAIGLTARGLGIGIVDEFSVMDLHSDRVVVRFIEAPPFAHLHIHTNRDAARSRYVQEFEHALLQFLDGKQ
ncbi:LysR family transcriptional regulator [Bradyrhizobium liaoningense]|uniref:LysR family transcriptional regulator n=1 Tax=Bradyrhizobium liaoningense TaxID=43992 RepID=UPI001BA73A41|nr:LysR family transcriptional regulator [Bradyrhizobium liaoningense]MBR0855702.1 LysR family transcriptional regulator [Bradyrhizobium liaoningense]